MMDTTEPVTNAGKEAAPQQLNVGMALREARERMGMSVNDVADRIKFAPRQVEALESNDFVHLPQATFLRGFVRSYARVLQLDEATLIAALPVEPSPHAAAKAQAVDVAFPTMHLLQRVNVLWLAGALGVALVLALFVLLHDGRPAATPSEVVVESLPLPAPDTAVSAVTAAPAITAPIATAPATPAPVATVPAAQSSAIAKTPAKVKAVEPVKAGPIAVAPAPVAASAPDATIKSPVPLELLKRRPLHFVFSEKSWAEVIDVNGDVLLSRTNPAGSEQWIGGPRRAPYDISIGNPASVKLYYKGREIDLSPYAGMETARLKVE